MQQKEFMSALKRLAKQESQTVEEFLVQGLQKRRRKKSQEKDRQNWRTDPKLFQTLHEVFHFTVDACADEHNALLDIYWTNADKRDWRGHRVFCNPPFGEMERKKPSGQTLADGTTEQETYSFLTKAGSADVAVFLLPDNVITTSYFWNSPPDWLVTPRGRWEYLPPLDPDGKPIKIETGKIDFGSILAIYNATKEIYRLKRKTDWHFFKFNPRKDKL